MLHYGPSVTRKCEVSLQFAGGGERWQYDATLAYATGDAFVFDSEVVGYDSPLPQNSALSLGSGHSEALLGDSPQLPVQQQVNQLVARMSFFHFHDTSATSPLRQNAQQADSKYVRSDGSNLAAYLFRLKHGTSADSRAAWELLEGLVRRIAPYIKALEPDLTDPDQGEASAVRLYWLDERDYRFDVHDLSDGTLRAIALFAALTQLPATRPKFITIDEPELGLHPAAVATLCGLVRSASEHSQILVATQSPAILDEFLPEEVVVAERSGNASTFRRLDGASLEAWLAEYSLSELYDKNVLGGRP